MVAHILAKVSPLHRGRTIDSDQTTSALVDEAGLDSFPASDPPGWTLGVVHQSRGSDPAAGGHDADYLGVEVKFGW